MAESADPNSILLVMFITLLSCRFGNFSHIKKGQSVRAMLTVDLADNIRQKNALDARRHTTTVEPSDNYHKMIRHTCYRMETMSLMSAFELGLWNAWIFVLRVRLMRARTCLKTVELWDYSVISPLVAGSSPAYGRKCRQLGIQER